MHFIIYPRFVISSAAVATFSTTHRLISLQPICFRIQTLPNDKKFYSYKPIYSFMSSSSSNSNNIKNNNTNRLKKVQKEEEEEQTEEHQTQGITRQTRQQKPEMDSQLQESLDELDKLRFNRTSAISSNQSQAVSRKTKFSRERIQIRYDESDHQKSESAKDSQNDEKNLKQQTQTSSKIETSIEKPKKEPTLSDSVLVRFEKQYEIIKEFRKSIIAAVDVMGSHLQGDPNLSENDRNFQLLMSVILSVQTKDETTHAVMQRITREKISLSRVLEMPKADLLEIIHSVNFNAKKVEYIKNAAMVIQRDHKSKVPDKFEDLVKINGIGPKIAHLFLQCAYDKTSGIAVDTHMHRISNRLEWVDTNTPEQTRVQLEQLAQKDTWKEINVILVGFGQKICKPVSPLCASCPIATSCPSKKIEERKAKQAKKQLSKKM